MSLSVKDPEAHRLAEAISHLTGETLTRAVIRSLEERLERLDDRRRDPEKIRRNLMAIADRAAASDNLPYSNHDFLYDEFGLPK